MNPKPDSQPSLPPEFVLSRASGEADAPKDFDWVKTSVPCQAACPAHTDIPGYLEAIARRDYAEAYRINLADNVFPAVLGRVCTRPCEPACRHGWEGLGESVAICFSKRSAAEFSARNQQELLDPVFASSSKRVAVIGGGAAGLTVARQLCLWGHAVTVFEQHDEPGGLMVQGIPPFRLPREVVRQEIAQLLAQGIELQCGVRVGGDVSFDQVMADYDAVVLAAGTHKPFVPDIEGVSLDGVQHGLVFLKAVHAGASVSVGQRVVVIGGGFTAVDCARTARRLGAASVSVYYRRSPAEMYIAGHELQAMQQEGISFTPQAAPLAFHGADGRVNGVRMAPTLLGEPDASGRRSATLMPDGAYDIEADTVLLGTGQQPDLAWLPDALRSQLFEGDRPVTGSEPRTNQAKLFLAGDFAMGALSLIDAIGHAKACALQVDTWLMGRDRFREVVEISDARTTGRTRAMDALPRELMPEAPVDERGLEDEVEQGLSEEAAVREAQRCYLCDFKFEIDNDLCIYCDRCLKVTPVEGCIVKVSHLTFAEDGRITGYQESQSTRDYNLLFIDQKNCIRCGACAEVCPVECISLQRVKQKTVPVTA
jgi:NADPH-dependent glutamate synthase beta subunit-like oxidoreductase/ferredoxin